MAAFFVPKMGAKYARVAFDTCGGVLFLGAYFVSEKGACELAVPRAAFFGAEICAKNARVGSRWYGVSNVSLFYLLW